MSSSSTKGAGRKGSTPGVPVHVHPPLTVLREKAARRHTVSYSMLSKFEACPLCWFASYFTDAPQRKSGTQYMGTTIHKVLHDQVAEPHPVEEVPSRYKKAWNSMAVWQPKRPGDPPAPEWHEVDWGAKSLEAMYKQAEYYRETGLKLLAQYFSGPHRNDQPLYLVRGQTSIPTSELELMVDITPYGGKQLTHLEAHIDRVCEGNRILDYKTKAGGQEKALTKTDAEYSMQGVIYAFGLEEAGIARAPFTFQYGQLVYGWGISPYYDCTIDTRIQPWRVDAFRQVVLPERIRAAEEKLDIVLNHPDPEAYFRARIRPGTHCKWCDVRKSCPWTSGGK